MRTRMLDAASRTMPGATARFAAGLMLVPGRRMPERPEQRAVMRRAQRDSLTAGGHRVTTYRWGTGEPRILLAHGWSGRAAQFAGMVERLEPHATVVSFDAPAHGASRGVTADIGMWIEAIRALDAAVGGFDLLVGHSFGGLAVRRASLAGLVRGRIVSISAPPSTDAVMQAYAGQIGLPDAVARGVSTALAHRLGPVMAAIATDPTVTRVPAAPLLVAHDTGDRVVPAAAAEEVAVDWPGSVTVLHTQGRGHNGILIAPEVLDAVAALATEPAETSSVH